MKLGVYSCYILPCLQEESHSKMSVLGTFVQKNAKNEKK